jgi:hypothetical protein
LKTVIALASGGIGATDRAHNSAITRHMTSIKTVLPTINDTARRKPPNAIRYFTTVAFVMAGSARDPAAVDDGNLQDISPMAGQTGRQMSCE